MGDISLSSALKLRVEPGTFLFKEGDSSKDLYIVQFGKIRIYKSEGAIDIDLAEVGAGGIVGEVAAIDNGTRSASGVALETSEVLVVPIEDFNRILEKIPDWFRKIATILVQRLREANANIHRTMGGECTAQIAALMALMTYSPCATSSAPGFEIAQKSLENELVDVLGLQLSDVTQSLAQLDKQGLIEIGKGTVVVKNRDKLEELGTSVFRSPQTAPAT